MRILPLIVLFVIAPVLAENSADKVAIDPLVIEREVAAVERAFAATMAARDFDKFASFIDDDAVFWDNKEPLRGKARVLEVWKEYFSTPEAPFGWKPETVMVLESGGLAHSTGPVWTPDGRIVAYYHSTWRKNAHGQWKIVLDKGQALCTEK